jgi:hypothetical protein
MAAGVDANRRCLVIRGISDYADSHKSDVWRSHAAGKAAAFARELLCRVPSSSDLPLVRNTVSGHGTIQRCLAVVIDWPMQY